MTTAQIRTLQHLLHHLQPHFQKRQQFSVGQSHQRDCNVHLGVTQHSVNVFSPVTSNMISRTTPHKYMLLYSWLSTVWAPQVYKYCAHSVCRGAFISSTCEKLLQRQKPAQSHQDCCSGNCKVFSDTSHTSCT